MIELLRLILHIVTSLFKPRAKLAAEILVLRQQLNVLRRQVSKRPQLNNADRFLLVWLYRWFPSVLGAIAILRPETIIRWHRGGFRVYWRSRSGNRVGRPRIAAELRKLIGEMSRANHLWGAPHIHGELLKLGFTLAQSTVVSHGNLGFAQPASLRKPNAPSFECRPLCDTGEQHVGCLVEIGSQHLIAAFRDSARPVGLPGCVSSGRQPDIGSDASRPPEASRVIDRRKKAKSRNWTDARCRHKPAHLSIIAGQPHQLAIEVGNLPSDSLACPEQRLNRGSEFWPSPGQLGGAHGKHVHLCLADDEPEILEKPADLVLNIPLDLDEQSSADEERFDRVAVEIFDADLLVPSTLHDACNAHGVIAVALVDLQLQSSLRMPGIDADGGQPHLIQLGP